MKKPIGLGDLAKDLVTGFTGVVVARTEWLNGCIRLSLQPQGLTKEGKVFENQTIDEPQLELIKAGVAPYKPSPTGGPIPNPTRQPAISR